MENKICSKCNNNSYYAKGLCKKCYQKDFLDKYPNYYKNRYLENREKNLIRMKNYNLEHKDDINNYQNRNKEKIRNYNREYHLKNKEKAHKNMKEYFKKNKNIIQAKTRIKMKEYYKNNTNNHRLIVCLRARVGLAIKRMKVTKKLSTMELVGCSGEFLYKYLEDRFKEGMTWQNMGKGGWVIDHIKPCCSFDLTKLEEQKKCFHYSNLRPYWENINIKKGIEDRKLSIRKKDV